MFPEQSFQIAQQIRTRSFSLEQPLLFVGLAETATALGFSLFDSYANHAMYIHTTREQLADQDSWFDFEEEHSHATAHRCYPLNEELFKHNYPLVLVDDEMTTGKTALNLIRAVHRKAPRRDYIIATLLDWRSEADQQRFMQLEKELDIQIRTVSLLGGTFQQNGTISDLQGTPDPIPSTSTINIDIQMHDLSWLNWNKTPFCSLNVRIPYIRETGRFGIDSEKLHLLRQKAKWAGEFLRKTRKGNRTLCLGTGEFMYMPFLIASWMGKGVRVQSTTRSPISPKSELGYAVQNGWSFESPEHPGVTNFLYNIQPSSYDEVYIFFERRISMDSFRSLCSIFEQQGMRHVNVVSLMTN
jgi:hypothetical protein